MTNSIENNSFSGASSGAGAGSNVNPNINPYTNNPLAGRDLLRLLDLTPEELELILSTATKQKSDWKNGIYEQPYTHLAVAIILEKPSMRTRNSFDIGVTRLGAHSVIMSDDKSAFSRGETVHDTTLVLERFVDAIVLRTFEQSKIEEVAKWASIPVINALTDDFHPCQVLADLLTIREHLGALSGLTLAYVGDGNNMANSYLEGGALSGMNVKIASPKGYEVSKTLFDECTEVARATGATLQLLQDPNEAVSGANIVVTDTWTSMGDEAEHDKRLKSFEGFRVDARMMARADKNAVFMHCLPAHRGEEVTDEVMDGKQSVIFDEAENRLHAQKAVLSLVLA